MACTVGDNGPPPQRHPSRGITISGGETSGRGTGEPSATQVGHGPATASMARTWPAHSPIATRTTSDTTMTGA